MARPSNPDISPAGFAPTGKPQDTSQQAFAEPRKTGIIDGRYVHILVGKGPATELYVMRLEIFEDMRRDISTRPSPIKDIAPFKRGNVIDTHTVFSSGDPTHFKQLVLYYEVRARNGGEWVPISDELYDAFCDIDNFRGAYAEAHKLGLKKLKAIMREHLFGMHATRSLLGADAVYLACPDESDFRNTYTRDIIRSAHSKVTVENIIETIQSNELKSHELQTDLLSCALRKLVLAYNLDPAFELNWECQPALDHWKDLCRGCCGSLCPNSPERLSAASKNPNEIVTKQGLAQAESSDWGSPPPITAAAAKQVPVAVAADADLNGLDLLSLRLESISSQIDNLCARITRQESVYPPPPPFSAPPPPPPPSGW